MKFLSWFLCLVLVNFLHQPSTFTSVDGGAALIEATCKKTDNVDLCLKILKSDPRSSSADVKGLTHIAMEAGLNYTRDSFAQVKKMYNEASNKELKACLHVCVEVYDLAVSVDFPTAIRALESNHIQQAGVHLSAVLTAPATCRDTFAETPGIQTPPDLVSRNDQVDQFAIIAIIILKSIG